jgi:hypothetical protein
VPAVQHPSERAARSYIRVRPYRLQDTLFGKSDTAHHDGTKWDAKKKSYIAVDLLLTCHAIDLETCTLLLSLNPYIIYHLQIPGATGMKLHEMLPWQLALLQSLDITLRQQALKGGKLRNYLLRTASFRVRERHEGVYMAPRRFKGAGKPRVAQDVPVLHNYTMLFAADDQDRQFIWHLLGEKMSQQLQLFQPP